VAAPPFGSPPINYTPLFCDTIIAEDLIMIEPMRFASAISRNPDPEQAAREVAQQIDEQLGGRPDLALAFFSGYPREIAAGLAAQIGTRMPAGISLGCTAESVIGWDEEIENQTALSVVAACLPGVNMAAFAVDPGDWPEVISDPDTFLTRIPAPGDTRLFVLLADPFSSPMDEVLALFNSVYEGIPVIGGMASAGSSGGENVLFLHGGRQAILGGGAVGVALSGAFEIDVIVSQGCRPVGRPYRVTAAQKNILIGLEDRSPMACLQELFDALPQWDRDLLQNGVYLGRAIDPGREELGRGDFVIRGVMGADRERGFIAVGDYVSEGENVQFHLRDANTASEDLEMMLLPQSLLSKPAGAFLFSCNGRGTNLYDHPNGDVRIIQDALGGVPLAGFFCAGEIGPVGGKNFLHGHTASMAIFRQERED
jgi:small ligand-binding sensory domain FIST